MGWDWTGPAQENEKKKISTEIIAIMKSAKRRKYTTETIGETMKDKRSTISDEIVFP